MYLLFKKEHIMIKVEKINSVSLNEEDSTVDIYLEGDEEAYELKKYKFNEVISAIENAKTSNLLILEIN